MGSGRAESGQTQLDCFRAQWEALSYPAIQCMDVFAGYSVPGPRDGQKDYLAAGSRPSRRGSLAIGYFYFQSVVGWALSLLAVAGFSGLVKSR